jgi:hypothetical protein
MIHVDPTFQYIEDFIFKHGIDLKHLSFKNVHHVTQIRWAMVS